MGLFSNRPPPNLPLAPKEYTAGAFDRILGVLRLYYQQLDAVQQINIAKININVDALPTEADLANLRVGDVYRDTTASDVLKVKV